MRLAIPLHRRPAIWLLAPGVALLYLVDSASQSYLVSGSWSWAVAHSVLLLIVPAAVGSTGTALEASRVRSIRESNALVVRAGIRVLVDSLWPGYLSALSLQFIAILFVVLRTPPVPSQFPWAIFVAIAAMLAFHCCLGLLAGAWFPKVVGIPLALAVSYCWLGFTGTTEWMPLRHLAGLVLETCCAIDQQIIMASVASATIFSLLGAIGFAFLAMWRLNLGAQWWAQVPTWVPRAPAVVGIVALMIGTGAGLWSARDLGSTASEPRAASDLVCDDQRNVLVCLYPEQWEDPNAGTIFQYVSRIRVAGISMPETITAGYQPSTAQVLYVRYEVGMDATDLAYSLSSSFNGDQTMLCDEPAETTIARYQVGEVLRAWLFLRMVEASDTSAAIDSLGIKDPGLLVALLNRPLAEQQEWIQSGITSLFGCEAAVPDTHQLVD